MMPDRALSFYGMLNYRAPNVLQGAHVSGYWHSECPYKMEDQYAQDLAGRRSPH